MTNVIGIKVLEQRIEKAKAELTAVEQDILRVEELRESALENADEEIANRMLAHGAQLQSQALVRATADARVGQAEQHRQQARDLEKAAAELRTQADQMDLLVAPLEQAKASRRAAEKYWAAELARVQSPDVRRKRTRLASDIEKLARRVARKVVEPELGGVKPVMPQNYGTPTPEPTPEPTPTPEPEVKP